MPMTKMTKSKLAPREATLDERIEAFEPDPNAHNACPVVNGELDRERLDALLTEAEQSPLDELMDDAYFARWEAKIDSYRIP